MKKKIIMLVLIAVSITSRAQLNFTDLVGKTEKAVVSITTRDEYGNPETTGTGFFIAQNGTLLSNLHIFENAYSASITAFNNNIFEIDSVLLSSKEYDIIKFSIHNPQNIKFNYLEFKTQNPQKGEDIFTIGNPLGLESTVSKGIISSVREIENLGNLYQITAAISAGSSGSPVMNMKGEVIGIATFQFTDGQNLNFAIDVDFINRINQNEFGTSELNTRNLLPSNQDLAWQSIDSMWITNDNLQYLNEYIRKYPNDYRGFLKRAFTFSGSYITVQTFIEDKYKILIIDPITDEYKRNLDENGQPVTDSMYNIGISKVYQRSIPDYAKALELRPNEPLIYYYRGLSKLYCCQSNPNKIADWTIQSAIDDLLKSNNLNSSNLETNRFFHLGLAYLELAKFKSALSAFNQALTIKDASTEKTDNPHKIYFEIAQIKYDQLKDTIGSLKDLNKAIELITSIPMYQGENHAPSEYLAKRAQIKYAQGKYSEALEDISKVNKSNFISNDGRSSFTHYLESSLLLQLDGDIDSALEAINVAIQWLDSVEIFYKTRANVHKRLKNYSDALKDLNTAFDLNPEGFDDWNYAERSIIKGLLNDNIGAIKDIDAALVRNSQESYYYDLKAIYLRELGDDIGAEKQYAKAIELDPNNADYYISRGWTRLKFKKTEACADWSKAGELGNYKAYDLIQKYCQ